MNSNLRNRTAVRNPFTLLELVVVISILALASTFAVATFRGESPARQMENASLQFEAFCAKVRFNAMENGEDRIVLLNPDTRQFLVKIPEEFQEKENEQSAIGEISTANPNGDGDGKIFLPKWTLPEEFSLERADFEAEPAAEAARLYALLTAEGFAGLDEQKMENILAMPVFASLRGFALGRERAFLLSVPAREIGVADAEDELLVQGVIDLLAVRGEECIIVDYKYSSHNAERLAADYLPQLRIYAAAARRIPGVRRVSACIVNILRGFSVDVPV